MSGLRHIGEALASVFRAFVGSADPVLYAARDGAVCRLGAGGEPHPISMTEAISRHATWTERAMSERAEGMHTSAANSQAIADELLTAISAVRQQEPVA